MLVCCNVFYSVSRSSIRRRLEDQAERTKKVLSANSETTFAVECLMEDHDLSGLITRELFEELCAESFKPALLKLLHQALSVSGAFLLGIYLLRFSLHARLCMYVSTVLLSVFQIRICSCARNVSLLQV